MIQGHHQKIKHYIEFREKLDGNPNALEKHPHLKAHYNSFIDQLNLILKIKEQMEEFEDTSNFHALREDLVVSMASLSRKFIAFAVLEELIQIQGTFCYTYDELSLKTDKELISICCRLISSLQEYSHDLAEYGIDSDILNNFQDLSDKFAFQVDKNLISKQISNLISKTDELLENELVLVYNNSGSNKI